MQKEKENFMNHGTWSLRILNCFKIYGLNYDRIHKFWFDHNNSDSYIELNIRLCS